MLQPPPFPLFPYTTLFRSFSPVVRTENRYAYTDNLSLVWGNHTMKFGGDANFVSVSALFELNFAGRSEEHTSELQSQSNLVCRLLLEKKNLLYCRLHELTS